MNYQEELNKYLSNFMDKLKNSFEMANTAVYVKTEQIKETTQFGYKINEIQTQYNSKPYKVAEYPFKWGFNGERTVLSPNSFNEEFYVANEPKMSQITQQTIDEQDGFFDTIIAKLLLQDFVGMVFIPPEHYPQLAVPLTVTAENSSKYGSIDYLEYIFILRVFEQKG